MVVQVAALAAARAGSIATKTAGRVTSRNLQTGFDRTTRNAQLGVRRIKESLENQQPQNNFRQRPSSKRRQQREISYETSQEKPEKLGGIFFWLTAGIAITKDIAIDPLLDLLIGGGIAISATVVGAVAGIPLVLIAWSLKFIFLLFFFVSSSFYFSMHGGISTSIKIARLAIWLLGGITEMIPMLSILPITAVVFFAVAFLENAARGHGGKAQAARIVVKYAQTR